MKYINLKNWLIISLLIISCEEQNNPIVPNSSAPEELIDPIPYDILVSGKILFKRIGPDGGSYDCFYIIDIDQQKTWKVNNDKNISSPCISPRGDKITFTQYTDLETAFDVYIMDLYGDNVKQLSSRNGQDRFPSWNSSGNFIFYWYFPCVICSVKPNGTNDKIIQYDSRRAPSGRLSVSATDKVIYACNSYYLNDTIYSNRIFMMNIDGSGIESIIEAKEDYLLESPRFSPDDLTIAYLSIKKDANFIYERMEIHLYDISYDEDKIIFESAINGMQYSDPGIESSIWLCWSPDGSKILFTKPAHLQSYIFVINKDGSQLTQVTSLDGVTDRSISWSE